MTDVLLHAHPVWPNHYASIKQHSYVRSGYCTWLINYSRYRWLLEPVAVETDEDMTEAPVQALKYSACSRRRRVRHQQ